MKNALAATITTLPEQLRRSLTWDRGKELSAHAQFKIETGVDVYFADPQSPWQRGTNENTNGLLRQYFPKGTDLARWSAEEIEAVANALNSRPRRILGWKTPAEALNDQLLSFQQAGVAEEYPSLTAASAAVARQLGVGPESVRRWVLQADVDTGCGPGVTSEELAEIKALKDRVRRLEEDNAILKAATVFFVGELDPRNR